MIMFRNRLKYSSRFLFILLIMLACCKQPAGNAAHRNEDDKKYEVLIVQQRWHTGIIFNTRDVDPQIWPEIERYTDRRFVDVGWGDEKFWQVTGDPVGLAARAMLFPTSSVLQVFAFNTQPSRAYGAESRILRIPVSSEQFADLSRFVNDYYLRDEEGNIQRSTVFGEAEHFFLARGKYHLFRTCNTWVARGFKQAGFDVRSFCVLNANQLFRQLRDIPGAEFMQE